MECVEDILVAPYWNLNAQGKEGYSITGSILVAPYWNLNSKQKKTTNNRKNNISSSILEFKSQPLGAIFMKKRRYQQLHIGI